MSERNGLEGIAIVGMAGKFPRARDVQELWANLRAGIDGVSDLSPADLEVTVPEEMLRDPAFVRARGVLEDVELFDASFFDIAPRQAELMDPQNRLFLETCWQALEDAGCDPERFAGPIGVFGGVTFSTYFLRHLLPHPELLESAGAYQTAIATDRDYLTTFVSYKLGLRGPSLDVQTACSTSLVATVLACQSLLAYQCDLALAGGVSVKLPQRTGYLYKPGGLDSATGRCRSFDAGADGSVYGSGVGVVALKRLEDALADGDPIHAVILGGALNNDGAGRVGFTAPGVEGQSEAIATAHAVAGVDPATIGYVECHGSGTALGDPIEIAALTRAFRAGGASGRGGCAVGSIKSSVGHLSAAAGVAGLIKAALALREREIPPSLHFTTPNPGIDFAASPFYVADRPIPWEANGEPRRAGVSSFGLGGTNAHVVLEEAPEAVPSGPSRPWQLLLLSARTAAALESATDRLAADLAASPDRPLADVAFTTQVGRRAFEHRRALVCRDPEDAHRALAERDPRRLLDAEREPGQRPVAFLLPGVGDEYAGMARGLYDAEPVFREHFDRCAEILKARLGVDLRELVFAEEGRGGGDGPDLRRMLGRAPRPETEAAERLHRTLFAQPAVFAVDYALARLWMSWGVRPSALLGYSLGEYVAACLAGTLSLDDALLLVAERARLIDGLPGGAMLAVPLGEARVRELLAGTDLDLAAVNAPEVCVVAGPAESIESLRARLAAEDVPARLLPGTHAFHSRRMEPAAEALTRLARGVRLAPPRIPWVSNVTGTWITPAEATDPGYWARHLAGTVRFAAGVATLWQDPARVLLEAGPGFGLSTLALQNGESGERLAVPSLRHAHDRQDDEAFILGALGRLWLAGVEIDWTAFSRHEERRRVRLPGYPFERQRFWIEPGQPGAVSRKTPGRREVVAGGLSGEAFERARAAAPGTRLVLIEDEATALLIARLRELEALGAEVVVAARGEEIEDSVEEPRTERPPALAAQHARPRLRNAYVEPVGEEERWIAGLFAELLGFAGVGAHDSFFELGGQSLLATRITSRLRDRFGVELPLQALFEAPTPSGLAVRVATAGPGEIPLVPVPRGEEIPLSYAQQRLWFLDRLMPGNPFYNLAGGARLSGPLDALALRAALAAMARRHETLRTSFAELGGRPAQRIAPVTAENGITLPLIDLVGLPGERREAATNAAAAGHARRPFDLGRAPLLRCALLRTGPDEHVLLWAMHHIVSDAWSMTVLLREVAILYTAFARGEGSPLPPLPVQYADFALWQRRLLDSTSKGGVLERQLGWWRERLAGAPVTELPTDHPRPALQTFRGATLRTAAPASLAAGVAELARQSDASPFMVLLAVFQALLLRTTAQEDIVVGAPIANRTRGELEGLLGFFVNTLVLRTDLGGDPPFAELVGRVRAVCLGAYAHQDLPFEQLVEALQPRRDLARNPLVQILFNLLNVPPAQMAAGGDLSFAPLTPPGGTALVDLQAYVTHSAAGIGIAWEHNTDLFEGATIARLAVGFETLLTGAVADPSQRLADLPLLTEAERGQLLTGEPAEPLPSALELFEAQAARNPDAIAVAAAGESLTYGELEARARQLAEHLRSLGVGAETLVGVCLERSPDLIAALLAVWKAGGAYVPLDPSHPAERRAWILADAGVRVVVGPSPPAPLPQAGEGCRLEGSTVAGDAGLTHTPLPLAGEGPGVRASRRAYVLYTSGSTGRPKGVEVTHGAFAAFLAAMARRPGLGADDVLLAVTTVSFDIAGLEIFLPLAVGARIELAEREEAQDGRRLAARIAEAGVTVLQATPATWRLLLASGWEGDPRLCALCGGEALPPDLAAALTRRVAELWNGYGPTETTVFSTFHPVVGEPTGAVPIGRPIEGTSVHLLGLRGALVPPGGIGELAIGGAGVARGYLGRPELTAERFVPDPFAAVPGARLYRSGDLARWRLDGDLEYLGRIDHQVKLRGYRIEPGEIEAALAADPGVREAVVALRGEDGGEPRLVAWVVWRDGAVADLQRLREELRQRLPAYMLPAAYVEVERLPLTPSGKVDRRALPAPVDVGVRGAGVPRTATEEALARIWAAVLGIAPPGPADDFFELGGHSLLATQVMARLLDEFGVEIPLAALFRETTLERLAALVDRERDRGPVDAPPLVPAGAAPGEPVPLSFAQERLWFLDRLDGPSAAYNLPYALRLTGRLDVAALAGALTAIVRRHAALRTSFAEQGGGPVQIVAPPSPFDLPVVDLAAAGPAEARRLAAAEARRPFDLGRPPMLRATLLRMAAEDHVVLVTLHHIAGDAWSLGVLTRELAVFYESGVGSPSPGGRGGDGRGGQGVRLQYADFARWQREWLRGEVLERQLAFWRATLASAPVLQLPTDRPRPPVQTFRGAGHPFTVPAPLAASLGAAARGRGATLYMALLAGLIAVLRRWSGQDDLCVGTPVAGRPRVALEELIGFFVNTLVLRTGAVDTQPLGAFLTGVRDVALAAFAHPDVPFEKLVEELRPERDLSRTPFFQVLFTLQNVPAGELRLPGLTLAPFASGADIPARFDLTLAATETADGLGARLDGNVDLFDAPTIARLAGHWLRALEALAGDPSVQLGDLPLLGETECHQLLAEWGAGAPAARPALVQDLIAAQAARTPDAPALIAPDRTLTYREMEEQSGRLAHALRAQGVGPDTRVAVAMERSPELIVAFLGVLKAGGLYVPIDPGYPRERIDLILADAGAAVVLGPHPWPLPRGAGEGDLAAAGGGYVIYTSGSTGRPKGVVATSAGLAAFTRAMVEVLDLGPGDRVLQYASPSFDASAVSIYPALASGAAVVLHPDPTVLAPGELLAYSAGQGATVLDIPAALWRQVVQEIASGAVPPSHIAEVRAWLTGGEALSVEALRQWAGLVREDAFFLSSYGPTEATVTTSIFTLTARQARSFRFDGAPIGRPLGAVEVLLLDGAGRPVPLGVPGELLVGGPGVTRGYLGRPELTAAAFLPHPLAGVGGREPGARVYRTGDLARRRGDGSLEFLGRADQQLKIRGFRIEPGEIEEILASHPEVVQAVVGAREGAAGDRRLVAWVVVHPKSAIQNPKSVLSVFLRARLPEHMVPADLVLLDALPLTPGGKVDRRGLPDPDPERNAETGGEEDFAAPLGEMEETLAAVWSRLLGIARVGRRDDFFARGGHSLLATQLVSRLREVFGVELPLRQVFETPTLAALATAVEEARRDLSMAAAPPLRPRASDGQAPLSFAQERLWFIDQLQPGLPTYVMPEVVRLTGPLDIAAMEGAFAVVVERHEPLRTRFVAVGGAPVQVVDPPAPFRLPVADLSMLPEDVRETERARLVRADAARPIDLARGPLLRAGVVRLGAREHVLVVILHHIIVDGWALGVLIRELGAAYAALARGARPELPPLPVQYADWAVWQREWLRGEPLEAQLAYWRGVLGGEVPPLDLPLDHPRPAGDVVRGARRAVRIPAVAVAALEALGREEESTLFLLTLTGFAALLHRLTGQDDLTVGTPVAGRTRGEVEGLLGLFLNTLALRADLGGDPPLRTLLRRLRAVSLDAWSHQDLPFEKIVEELQPERVVGRTPFFQAMLVLQNAPAGALAAGDLEMATVPAYNDTVRFDLTLSLTPRGGGLAGWLEYKPALLDATTVARWTDGFVRLLEGAAEDPDRRLSELPLLSAAERHQIVEEWNDTRWVTGSEETLHGLFAAQAARTPEAVAVDAVGEALTYRELERRAAGLAGRLTGRGVLPGDRVAILMRPSASRVAAALAVLAAGAAYVPLDPASPRERLEHMLRDAGARLLLADEPLPEEDLAIPVLVPGPSEAEGFGGLPAAAPGDLAYIIYTSGSTGAPKGVVIEHRQAVNTILDVNRRFAVGTDDRVFALSALYFDLSVWDLFGTLAAGGTIVLPTAEERADPAAWSARMLEAGVTVWNSAPPLLDMLVEAGAPLPPGLRLALLSGDWIPVGLPGRVHRQAPDCRVVSLGGATEGSIWSILFPIGRVDPAWRSIPYGRPMESQRFHVLGRHGEPVPLGAAGELYIGGAGVAVGYFARPELTAERFVPDPIAGALAAGARFYRTGDLGRHRADGTIEFLGRVDTQVKIRGFRVELGEIETVLSRHPGVREAVVLARQEGSSPSADRRLAAYVVPAPEGAPPAAELRAWLAGRLPDFMIPPHFVFLESLPVTPNGKLDRRALPAPDATPRERIAPRDSVERQLATIWERLLGLPEVGVEDNFFELGGHSLLATRLVAAVREEMGLELSVREVFERPTVAALAVAVAEQRVEGVGEDELDRLLGGIEGLSDEEIERLLAAEGAGAE